MGAYRTVIGVNFNQYIDNTTSPDRYLILDTQDDKQVTASAQIASQPLQDGDTMSDHMYREPVTVSLSGSFSLNGKNWNDDSYNFISKGDRLTNIQEAFEQILNEGLLCTLTTINEEDLQYTSQNGYGVKSDARNRFKIRKNMALKSINWVESQNTVKYTFNFNEVIMVEVQAQYEPLSEAEMQELGLPNINYPQASNLGSVMIENGVVPKYIIQDLYEKGYLDKDWLEIAKDSFSELWGPVVVAAVVAVVSAVAIGVAVGLGLAITASIFPVGTVIAGVAALGICIGMFIKKCVDKHKEEEAARLERAKREKAFKLINGSAEQDAERFKDLIDTVVSDVNRLQTNLFIYNINSNEEQQVVLNIANVDYIIDFIKSYGVDEDHYLWRANVKYMDDSFVKTKNTWCPVANIYDLNPSNNLWFKDLYGKYQVYLVNPSLDERVNDTEEKLQNARQHLDGYSIWVSEGNIQDHIKKIAKAIDDSLRDQGF